METYVLLAQALNLTFNDILNNQQLFDLATDYINDTTIHSFTDLVTSARAYLSNRTIYLEGYDFNY